MSKMQDFLESTREYRAVFSYPPSILGATPDTYGPWRSTLQTATKDRVPRSEETYGWRSGFQTRVVGPVRNSEPTATAQRGY